MGFMDFLFAKENAEEKKIQKLKKTITHMYVQPAERQYATEALRDIGTPDAILALLARFGEACSNSTTDADEKEYVYDTLVQMAKHSNPHVKDTIIEFLHEAEEKINWPLKVLTDILSYEEMTALVVELLASCNTDYSRNPEKKQELILRATEFNDVSLSQELVRFLEDDNETIRFLAVEALLQQNHEEIMQSPLRASLIKEDSLRIVQKLAMAFAEHTSWTIPAEEKDAVMAALPDGFTVHKDGYIQHKRR